MSATELPVLVWMLVFNREGTKQEYDACYELIKTCNPTENLEYDPTNPDSFRKICTNMLPLLMMRHRRISRTKWRDCVTPAGKHWIEQRPDDMPPEQFMHSMIGYHLAYHHNVGGMAMTQGTAKKVINIGLGIYQIASLENDRSLIEAYVESHAHKLTDLEMSFIDPSKTDTAAISRRLAVILALKAAYIKAIGQPNGFDYSRLEFDVPNSKALGDDHPLMGWEFRLWTAMVGVAVRRPGAPPNAGSEADILVEEQYQCASAMFRGTDGSQFVWSEKAEDLNSWVQFVNIDQIIMVIPKLLA